MSTQKDNRHGHRNRLRTRLTKAGRTAFADHELLELLLTYAIPRKDTKQLAKKIIDRFGSFAAVFDQPKERLLQIEGIGPQTSVLLSAIRASLTRYLEQKVENVRKAFPLLVRQAKAEQSIYYSALAEELDMPNPRNLNYALGYIGYALKKLGKRWHEDIPPIQSLVVNKYTGVPGVGF